MTQQQYIIKRKLNILDFAEQLGNISDACRRLGVSRQHYYDIRGALVHSQEFSGNRIHLRLDGMAYGMYILHLPSCGTTTTFSYP